MKGHKISGFSLCMNFELSRFQDSLCYEACTCVQDSGSGRASERVRGSGHRERGE